ncbi:MAG: efflux RND transporter periplasmic adaptor subunit [Chloroflexi bacterium]|nr:efflux RND transporter periplasmic adaptor subunit [Chloroflexota bacterium]
MRSRRSWIVVGIIVLLLAGGAAYYFQRQAAQKAAEAAALRTETVSTGDIFSTVSATGSIAPEAEVKLSFATQGTVAQVPVKVGDTVAKGQTLARLDTADLQLAVAQAEQTYVLQQANLEQLQTGSTEADIKAAKAAITSANAAYAAAQQQANAQPDQLVIAQSNLDKSAEALRIAQWAYDNMLTTWFLKDYAPNSPQAQALTNAQTDYHVAQADYNLKKSSINSSSVSAAYAQLTQAQANLAKLEAGPTGPQLKAARAQVEQARIALDIARANVAKATLTAPFAGVVSAVNVKAGEPANGALPAVVLVDTSVFHIDVTVDEVDVARIALGQLLTVTLDALPGETFSGKVDRVAPTATVNGGVVSYAVRLVLEPVDAPLRSGMSATADIVVAEAKGVVLVPNWAIRRDRDTGQVLVSLLKDGKLVEAPVTLGLRNESLSEVKSGVIAGDMVGISTLREALNLFGGG